jgi:hypothetical protein
VVPAADLADELEVDPFAPTEIAAYLAVDADLRGFLLDAAVRFHPTQDVNLVLPGRTPHVLIELSLKLQKRHALVGLQELPPSG